MDNKKAVLRQRAIIWKRETPASVTSMASVYAVCSRPPIVVLAAIVLALDTPPAYKTMLGHGQPALWPRRSRLAIEPRLRPWTDCFVPLLAPCALTLLGCSQTHLRSLLHSRIAVTTTTSSSLLQNALTRALV